MHEKIEKIKRLSSKCVAQRPWGKGLCELGFRMGYITEATVNAVAVAVATAGGRRQKAVTATPAAVIASSSASYVENSMAGAPPPTLASSVSGTRGVKRTASEAGFPYDDENRYAPEPQGLQLSDVHRLSNASCDSYPQTEQGPTYQGR